jgi:hypothetical protein
MAEDDTAAAKTEAPKSIEASATPKAPTENRAESVRS